MKTIRIYRPLVRVPCYILGLAGVFLTLYALSGYLSSTLTSRESISNGVIGLISTLSAGLGLIVRRVDIDKNRNLIVKSFTLFFLRFFSRRYSLHKYNTVRLLVDTPSQYTENVQPSKDSLSYFVVVLTHEKEQHTIYDIAGLDRNNISYLEIFRDTDYENARKITGDVASDTAFTSQVVQQYL
ncbi:MAG: solute carrier family 23 protein [Gammaproteobacteria bacterium]|nr:solute carrier family 23 protein [Gammaproteobacteria bacterium]MDH5801192.1 solute carrier family 23 protein [Gammaproteobacteria bacterium]